MHISALILDFFGESSARVELERSGQALTDALAVANNRFPECAGAQAGAL